MYFYNETFADSGLAAQYDSHLTLNHDTGEIMAAKAFDREKREDISFTLRCNLGSHYGERKMILKIKDVNDNAPYITHHRRFVKEENIRIRLEKTRIKQVKQYAVFS